MGVLFVTKKNPTEIADDVRNETKYTWFIKLKQYCVITLSQYNKL